MSRAFVKDQDGSEVGDDLPERVVSEHRNLVTPFGLARIEEELRRLREALAQARAADDRAAIARHSRDLRYWTKRHVSAEVVPPPVDCGVVRFGSSVVLGPAGRASVTFRIVGEDEAMPSQGTISYVSPLARALLGRHAGEIVEFAGDEAEILQIR